MFLQAVNGLFYLNPTIIGEDWFVKVYKDESDAQVVVKTKVSRKNMLKKLQDHGISAKFKAAGSDEKQAFPPDFKKLYAARSYYIEIEGSIPIPDLYECVVSSI